MTSTEASKKAQQLWGENSFILKRPDTVTHKSFCEVGIVINLPDGFGVEVYGYGWKWEDAFEDAKKKGHCK